MSKEKRGQDGRCNKSDMVREKGCLVFLFFYFLLPGQRREKVNQKKAQIMGREPGE